MHRRSRSSAVSRFDRWPLAFIEMDGLCVVTAILSIIINDEYDGLI